MLGQGLIFTFILTATSLSITACVHHHAPNRSEPACLFITDCDEDEVCYRPQDESFDGYCVKMNSLKDDDDE